MLNLSAPSRASAVVASLVFALCAASAQAQVPTFQQSFKHFKRYPTTGRWSQELVGYRNDVPMGPPATTTTCSGPLDSKTLGDMAQLSQQSSGCTTRTLVDQERLGEFETVCRVGARTQTLHMQLRAIDDRTILSETRDTTAGSPVVTVLKSKVTYLGPCTPQEAAAEQKPSAADCADIAQMRRDLNAGAGNPAICASLPAANRAQCEAQMAGSGKAVAALEAKCR